MNDIMIKTENLSKEYRLGQIGGGTLKDALQRLSAKIRKKEDPTRRIGAKDYNRGEKFKAVDNVSITIKKGERVGIIGANGAGKSTLLKLLSRVTSPTEGNIYLNGRVASMLEVGTGFHPELTGRENIYVNGAILGMTKKEIDGKIEKIIDFSEIREFIDTPVKRYSSGMAVKLAFSVSAHLDSEIMIMDEVLAVGDMRFQQKCLQKMSDVSHEEGRTVLYVSHNMNTIRQLCDRCIVLDHGKLIFDGDVESAIAVYVGEGGETPVLYSFPKTRRGMPIEQREAVMLGATVLGKDKNVYPRGETMRFILSVDCKKKAEGIRLIAEMTSVSPFGSSLSLPFNLAAGENKVEFSLSTENFAPGVYGVNLMLLSPDDFGGQTFIDRVENAMTFKITENALDRGKWLNSRWGNARFADMSAHNPSAGDKE